ncbi:unnamed protein product [Caenorhabditis nigoni]
MGQYTTYFNNTSGLTNSSYTMQLSKNGTWSFSYKGQVNILIVSRILKILPDFGSKNLEGEFATVWVDGVRRKGCQTTGEKQFPPGCKSFDGFNFTDKLLSTKSGYKWEMNNPDGLKRVGGDDYQDCLVLWIKPNEKLIDDSFCYNINNDYVKGYVCGKEPGY